MCFAATLDEARTPQFSLASRQYWDGEVLVFWHPANPGKLVCHGPKGARQSILGPDGTLAMVMNQGEVLAMVAGKDSEGETSVGEVHAWTPDKGWKRLGTVDSSHGLPMHLSPCSSRTRFLASNTELGFHDGNRGSFFAIFELRGDRFVFSKLIELEMDGRSLFEVKKPGNSEFPFPVVTVARHFEGTHPWVEYPLHTSDGFLMASRGSGLMWWVGPSGTGSVKSHSLFKVEPSELRRPLKIETAILGIQARRDGIFLLATRDEHAFRYALEGHRAFQEEASKAGPDLKAHATRDLRAAQARTLETFGDILWWEFDPATSLFERTFPEGAPRKVKDYRMFRTFEFTLDREDRVQVRGGRQVLEMDGSKSEQSDVSHRAVSARPQGPNTR